MSPSSPDEVASTTSAAITAGDAAARLLGITLDDVGPGRATVRMVVREDMLNGHAICHGGVIFTLADTAFAHACNSHGRDAVAAAASIDFLDPVPLGATLVATAIEQFHRGRTGLYDVVVRNGEDVVARFHGRSQHIGPSA